MPIPITIPRLGWNMESGTFIEWLVRDGDTVKPGDRLFRLEGEKSVEEIECFDAGELFIPPDAPKPGDSVLVGTTIGFLLQSGEAKPPLREGEAPAEPVSVHGSAGASPSRISEPVASPSVRRLAREKGIDLAAVAGSGPGGRITERDLAPKPATPRARRLAKQSGIDLSAIRGSGKSGRIRERDIVLASGGRQHLDAIAATSTTRKSIAARLMASCANTAPVTLTAQVDCVNLVNLREQFKVVDSPAPSFNDFFVKLAATALQQHPQLATRWADAGLVQPEHTNIGFAVDTDAGLLVPVIRDVPSLGLRQIAARSRELIEKARNGTLASRDMADGCFTITNLGSFGIDAFTPIINLPECAILGVGRIERRPVMDGDRVVGREQVWLSLTFDHRIVDGAPAARFLQTLARLIANPGPAILG
ncbi:MAG: dihydrolipoamide acetyltransferase family protein [Gemmataceae bacterium]